VEFVEQNGGVAHLYFHSWEIDEQGQWHKLETVLKEISERRTLIPATNGQLFARSHPSTAGVHNKLNHLGA
jgi:hypothetical protein